MHIKLPIVLYFLSSLLFNGHEVDPPVLFLAGLNFLVGNSSFLLFLNSEFHFKRADPVTCTMKLFLSGIRVACPAEISQLHIAASFSASVGNGH